MSVTGVAGTGLGAARGTSRLRRAADFLRRLLSRTDGLIGITILLMFTILALFPNLFVGPLEGITTSTGEPLQAPSLAYPFGTDELGRDLLSRLVWGGRISLAAGVAATVGALLIGLPVGLFSGYLRGPLELVAMRVTDVVLAFPTILLAIAIVAGLGPSNLNAIIAGTLVGFPFYARLVMGSALSLREREFVVAARGLGASLGRIVCRHLFPNTVETVLVGAAVDVGAKIVVMASLSFLGLGTQPPTPDWGTMLASGREFVTSAPHLATLPGLGIFFSERLSGPG
jgi:peptide/nickel transport system permease protein